MLFENSLEPKQQAAIDRLYEHGHTILIAPTGAGKTVICLTAIRELIDGGWLARVVVTCPAKVVEVWPKEVGKWEHLAGLRVVALTGTPKERFEALKQDSDVIVISLNNFVWLLEQLHGCDGVVVDELSKASGKQARKLGTKKRGRMFTWRVGMTATPVSQDFQKLYGMCRIIDGGKALGTRKQKYLTDYFTPDYNGHTWELRPGADALIMGRVKPLVHTVEDTKKEELPPLHMHDMRFDMPVKTRAIYNKMRVDMVFDGIAAANQAVKSGKLRQIASGFMYGEDENEDGKLEEFIEFYDNARTEQAFKWVAQLANRPGIIFYEYVEQLNRLMTVLVDHHIPFTCSKDGLGQILLTQIDSLSHGVEGLQHRYADLLFFQPMWSRDSTEQAIGRVWRKGQTQEVHVTTLICNDSLDDGVVDRGGDRALWMELFIKHLKAAQ